MRTHLREVQVDDEVHGGDIEPAGRHVSGNEHPRRVAFEGGQRGRALGLDRCIGAWVDGCGDGMKGGEAEGWGEAGVSGWGVTSKAMV